MQEIPSSYEALQSRPGYRKELSLGHDARGGAFADAVVRIWDRNVVNDKAEMSMTWLGEGAGGCPCRLNVRTR